MEPQALVLRLRCLSGCQPLLDDPTFAAYLQTLDCIADGRGPAAAQSYAKLYYLLKTQGHSGLGAFLWDWLRFTETPFGRLVEQNGRDVTFPDAFRTDLDAMRTDVDALLTASTTDLTPYLPADLPRPTLNWTADWDFDALLKAYQTNGCGLFARYRAFRWTGKALLPIPEPDSPKPWELWGYKPQRQQVADNARALVEGKQVNHVLLYGDSGTGKSATVKSLLSLEGLEALRIIELDKDCLEDIPALVRLLEHRPQKFILFLDDLSFESRDATYAQLKTILEGSLERQRPNVVVYATSNRRNLVRQTSAERQGDELDVAEAIEEATSLVQRFGVRIPFQALSPKAFRQMVADLAQTYGLRLPPQELEERARQWELRHPGRTPRVARQFIAYELDHQA